MNDTHSLQAINQLEEIAKEAEKNDKKLKEALKPYEPYCLKEIENIIQKAIKRSSKQNIEDKIRDYQIVLEKIDLIIKNSSLAFKYLVNKESIDAPEDYYNSLDLANIARERFRIEISELNAARLSKPDSENDIPRISTESGVLSEQNGIPSDEDTASNNDEYMTTKQVAKYLNYSESAIYHKVGEGKIPVFHPDNGRKLLFIRSVIDEWVRSGKPGGQQSSKINKEHFISKDFLEYCTNAFVREGYLDEDNAVLMNDRFSKETKPKKLIHWKKDVLSLITFVYLANRLGYIESLSTRLHNTSSGDDNPNEEDEIKYLVLVQNNFSISKGGTSESTVNRKWVFVANAVIGLRKKLASRRDIAEKDAIKKISSKDAISFYSKNKDEKSFFFNKKTNEKIDEKIFNIIGDFYIKNRKSASL